MRHKRLALIQSIVVVLSSSGAWAGEIYDFGDRGTFQVQSDGTVLQQDANGGWTRLDGIRVNENGTIYQNGAAIGSLSVSGSHGATLTIGNQTTTGAVSGPRAEPPRPPASSGPSGGATDKPRIDTATTLHPRVGTYDFGDKGRFVIAPDGRVLQDRNGQLANTGLRMDTLGRVLNANDQVVGRLIDEGGAPVFESRDGQRVRGKRVSGTYGDFTTSAGSGVPNGIEVDRGDGLSHQYRASDFAHPYAGIYQTTDGGRYNVARSTGRLWRFNEETRQFEAQPYFVDLSGNIVDLADNQIVGAIKPAAETGRNVSIDFNGQQIQAEWGTPAAGNFADWIHRRKQSFGKFLQPMTERFGGGRPVDDGGLLAPRHDSDSTSDAAQSDQSTSSTDTGVTRVFDMGDQGTFRVRPDGQVQQLDADGNWADLQGVVYRNGEVFRDGESIGRFHSSVHGGPMEYVDTQTGQRVAVTKFDMLYARGRENADWLRKKAGVYDFGDQGVYVVDDEGNVFRKEGDQLIPTENWIGMTAFGASIMDKEGRRIGSLNSGGSNVQITINGRRAAGDYYAFHELASGVEGPRRQSVCNSAYRSYYVSLVNGGQAGSAFSGSCD